MNKARYVPSRAHRTQRLALPAPNEEEYVAQNRPQNDIYDAESIEELIDIDPDFRRYWGEFQRITGRTSRPNKRNTPPGGSGVNKPKNPAWESFDDGDGGIHRRMPHGYAEGSITPRAIQREGYRISVWTDKQGGFMGVFYVTRRFVWILLAVLFLLFMAVTKFPDVVEIILKIL